LLKSSRDFFYIVFPLKPHRSKFRPSKRIENSEQTHQELGANASKARCKCPFVIPESATRLAIWPQSSFQLKYGYLIFAPLFFTQSTGKSSETGFHACFWGKNEGKFDIFCPFPRFGIACAVALEMLYLVDFLLFRWLMNGRLWQLQLWQLFFEGVLFSFYIYNYLYIRYL